MATTAKVILQGSWALRTANDPDKLATPAELLVVLQNFLQWMSGWINARNPEFLAKWTAAAAASAGVWAPPSALSTVLAAKAGAPGAAGKLALGAEIHIVPRTDKTDAALAPRIYREGVGYLTVGQTGDPDSTATGDKVAFLVADRFTALDPTKAQDAAENVLDPRWPEAYNTLPMLHLGKYLARKDGRDAGEIAALDAEMGPMLELLADEIGQGSVGVSARFGQIPRTSSTRARP